MRSRRTPFAVQHLWLAGAFLRDPEILARDSGTGCVLRWRGLQMSFHARQLIPALGKDQYFEVIREWDILCCNLHPIESGGTPSRGQHVKRAAKIRRPTIFSIRVNPRRSAGKCT